MLRRALLVPIALCAACGSDPPSPAAQDVPPVDHPTTDLGPLDAPALDTSDAPSPDRAGDDVTDAQPADAASMDADATPDVPPDVALDAPAADAPDDTGAPPCARDTDCVGFGERGVCDTARGRCVECLAARDLCPADQHCDDATHTCVDGCRSDDGCVGATPLRCDTVAHACVACTRDEHCPAGQLCIAHACQVGCSVSRPCAGAGTCCAGGCVDTASSLLHCGRCDAPCAPANAVAECRAGRCSIARCNDGFADCDGALANGCETDLRIDSAHCGACATACAAAAHTLAVCSDRACSARCEDGYDDCDANPANGCETHLASSTAHCGACGMRCALPNAAATCAAGRCEVARCNARYSDCDADPANGCEANTALDVNHCGGCATACPVPTRGDPVCAAGVCGVSNCPTGFGNCDGVAANGCEQSLTDSVSHCGACGLACATPPNAASACVASRCGLGPCAAGFASCDGSAANGCETDLTATAAHCGSCATVCPTGQSCAAGVCGCPAGRTYCGSACVDAANDAGNCGACGRRCASTQVCSAGACVYPPLRFVLTWTGVGDLDLRVRTPAGNDIWSGVPTADGGRLDANVRAAPGPETVYWVSAPTRGYYNFCVAGTAGFRASFTLSVYRGTTLAGTYTGTRIGTLAQQTCLPGAAIYVNRFSY